jgi:ABC-type dipeptide/oligopeptide/nickel transport system permease component
MWTFILRRILQTIPVLIGISIITFLLLYYLPADPARMYAGPSASVETVQRIRHELGLDQPLWTRYATYMSHALRGDLGFSYRKQAAVTELLVSRIPYTFALTLAGIFVELLIGLPVGIISAVARGKLMNLSASLLAGIATFVLVWFFDPNFPLGRSELSCKHYPPRTDSRSRRRSMVCAHDALQYAGYSFRRLCPYGAREGAPL